LEKASYSAQFVSQTNLCGAMNTKDLGPMAIASAVASHSGSAAMSDCAQYFATNKDEPINGWHKQGTGCCRVTPAKRSEMHRDDLMNPDLLSEIVLLGSATLIFITLLAILVTAFTRVAAL
jgi:hypothetical protein